jgi:hypothetical protein
LVKNRSQNACDFLTYDKLREKNYKKSEKISKDGLKDLLFFAFYITMERAKKRKMLSRLYKSGDGRAFCV